MSKFYVTAKDDGIFCLWNAVRKWLFVKHNDIINYILLCFFVFLFLLNLSEVSLIVGGLTFILSFFLWSFFSFFLIHRIKKDYSHRTLECRLRNSPVCKMSHLLIIDTEIWLLLIWILILRLIRLLRSKN